MPPPRTPREPRNVRKLRVLAVIETREPAAWVLSGDPQVIRDARERGLEVSTRGDAA